MRTSKCSGNAINHNRKTAEPQSRQRGHHGRFRQFPSSRCLSHLDNLGCQDHSIYMPFKAKLFLWKETTTAKNQATENVVHTAMRVSTEDAVHASYKYSKLSFRNNKVELFNSLVVILSCTNWALRVARSDSFWIVAECVTALKSPTRITYGTFCNSAADCKSEGLRE